MSILLINDIFSKTQLKYLHNITKAGNLSVFNGKIPTNRKGDGVDIGLGRTQIGDISQFLTKSIKDKLIEIASDILKHEVALDHALCAKYSNEYGIPSLPPHFDGDKNDLIINFQLSSNTSWDLGLNLDVYHIKDNSAAVFNGNTNIHWRPEKVFNDGEYLQMIFFRFYKVNNRSDYSYMDIGQGDPIFIKTKEFRDSLKYQFCGECKK